jgi:putative transposase
MDMSHPTPEHIVKLLRQADSDLAKGQSVEDFCRRKHISTATYYRWRHKYGGLNVPEAKRLKKLETENTKLKELLAESLLANEALQEVIEKKS